MKKSQKISKKIVVKVGSSLLANGGTEIVVDNLCRIVCHIADLIKEGFDVILVTSGAIACGLSVLGFKKKPKELAQLQASAAAGQNILMQAYSEAFGKLDIKIAQILLTREDFNDRRRYLNASSTINTLLKFKVVPVINENDAISIDQIKFGDNDTLSARVAAAVEADGLLILTDIDGLYADFDPKSKTYKNLRKEVKVVTPEIESSACGTDKEGCVGGMSTKIAAVRIATSAGVPVILATGRKEESLAINFDPCVSYDSYDGTRFPAAHSVGGKKHWIAFEAEIKGKVCVDAGAKTALVRKNSSLLAPGVFEVSGEFKTDDVVEVCDVQKACFAKGKVNFSSQELLSLKGKKGIGEVIHRDNLVITG